MVQFANTTRAAQVDGLPYATSLLMPSSEADLWNQPAPTQDPPPVLYGEAVLAAVSFQAQGNLATSAAYVVLQTDLGDGVWLDVAWCHWEGTTGTALFILSGGVAGANSLQQTRQTGAAPSPLQNAANQFPLGGRIRFVGQAAVTQPVPGGPSAGASPSPSASASAAASSSSAKAASSSSAKAASSSSAKAASPSPSPSAAISPAPPPPVVGILVTIRFKLLGLS